MSATGVSSSPTGGPRASDEVPAPGEASAPGGSPAPEGASAFDEIWQWRPLAGGAQVTGLVPALSDDPSCLPAGPLAIPGTLGGLPVTSMAPGAFSGAEWLSEIELPETLVEICERAFEESGLTWIALPPSLERIGACAFRGARKLTDVGFAEGLSHIGERAFEGAPLRYVELPATLESIGRGAFTSAGSLGGWRFKLVVAEGNPRFSSDGHALYERTPRADGAGGDLEAAGGGGSDGAGGLTCLWHWAVEASCEVAEGCTRIGDGAFRGETMLRSVTLPDTVTDIGDGAFEDCQHLWRADLPDGLERIGKRAFSGTRLRELHIPATLVSIGDGALAHLADGERALPAVDVDAANPRYSLASGFLLEDRSSGDGGADLRAIGLSMPAPRTELPRGVRDIAPGCFENAPVRELALWLGSLGARDGAFRGMHSLEVLHIFFEGDGEPTGAGGVADAGGAAGAAAGASGAAGAAAGGAASAGAAASAGSQVDVAFPAGEDSAVLVERCLRVGDDGLVTFDFAAYDAWLESTSDASSLGKPACARCALARLSSPLHLDDALASLLSERLSAAAPALATSLSRSHDFTSLAMLFELGLPDKGATDAALADRRRDEDAEAVAWLTDLSRRTFGTARPDLRL